MFKFPGHFGYDSPGLTYKHLYVLFNYRVINESPSTLHIVFHQTKHLQHYDNNAVKNISFDIQSTIKEMPL